jgi:hypothetical protein
VDTSISFQDQLPGLAIGALLAAVATVLGLIVQNVFAAKRQKAELTHRRELQHDEWKHQRDQQQAQWTQQREIDASLFTRDNLAALQDQIHVLVGAAVVVDDEKRSMYKALSPEELQTGNEFDATERYSTHIKRWRESRTRVVVLRARVDDDPIQQTVDRIVRIADDLVVTTPREWEEMARAGSLAGEPVRTILKFQDEVNDAIGARLRRSLA